ncbi:FAD-binding and (Fe-S)-binding domain-containing protein [Pelosinus sp. UFO1]|uniref:FAD-binding and (Fe-S)-binding domain-containing protein n=1 Tax=Pelosinus sp. UFO1 TaxID=484770 RepID=UPI0004D0B97C|nr:FAD-binding and (Fe-S)-binding domain-containing protein [Pelosinus sp. UFO1]AIF53914.1 D-lactate dehydrogenase (cytochrome) [Pelosinus sp. UFO1]
MSLKFVESDIANLPEVYRNFYHVIITFIPKERVFVDPIRTLAYGADASFYSMLPKLVVKVKSPEEMANILKEANKVNIPVTFRAAGTSLSGQSITDSVLLVATEGWHKYSIGPGGESIALEPGIIGAEANAYLKSYSRKIGPDPATINNAMIGGIAANNASGMCCGTADNSYKTVASMKLIFADGSMLDTGDAASREEFRKTHPSIIQDIEKIRDEITADEELTKLIKHKYKIKNTTGYGLNSFVDYFDPFDIMNHLMIGSEGTLAFITEITYKTVVDHEYKASALMIFKDMNTTCLAVMKLDRDLVAAAEMMDRASLRSVEDEAGMPAYLKTLSPDAASLLVEVRAESKAALDELIEGVKARLADIPTVLPIEFTDVKAEYEVLWHIRKGIFPAVGGMRKPGTSVIIEDVAFPKEKMAEAVPELRNIMDKYHYEDGIIYGHALDGNVHFVVTQTFKTQEEIERYQSLIQDVCNMVVNEYGGSLKAEHGTGRNMAPFVEMEWGQTAYRFMRKLKNVFDKDNTLNPDVIITDNQLLYIQNLKPMAQAHEIIDKCIECGFCEINCPSKNLTATPRQRIVVQREIARLRQTGEDNTRLRRLEEDYAYFGDETCATDGLCSTTCPVGINTGEHTKHYRANLMGDRGKSIGRFITQNFAGVTTMARLGLTSAGLAHSILGTSLMGGLTQGLHSLSGHKVPLWNPCMPGAGKTPDPSQSKKGVAGRKVVYFPSCVSRTMGGASAVDKDKRQLSQVMIQLMEKAGYEVIFPREMDKLCCGMPFESKGLFESADKMSSELEKELLVVSNNGEYPIVCDTSPCIYRMRKMMDKKLKMFEPLEFIHDYLLELLNFNKEQETIAVHVTCSSTKLGLKEKFKKVAEACATTVVMPEKVRCCGFAGDKGFEVPELNESALAELKDCLPADCSAGYSNSRTCEMGLSHRSGLSYQSIVYLVDRCTTAK